MPFPIDVIQGEVFIQAGFSQPAFDLLKPNPSLHTSIYSRLEKHGLRLTDIRSSRTGETLDDSKLEYSLFNYRLTLKLGLDKLEAYTFDTTQVSVTQAVEAFQDLSSGVREAFPSLTFKALSFTLQFHGTSADKNVREIPMKFINPPASMGPLASAGVIFTSGISQAQLTSSIIIEHSHAVANGIFIKLLVAWDPTKAPLETLKTSIDTFLNTASTHLGLAFHGIR